MIIVVLSDWEAERFCQQCQDPDITHIVQRQMRMSKLLRDDNMPAAVLLKPINDGYDAVATMYASVEAADRAWANTVASEVPQVIARRRDVEPPQQERLFDADGQ